MPTARKNSRKPVQKRTVQLNHGDALLIIDVINDLEFPGGEKVLPWAQKLAPRLAALKKTANRADIPVIYVNDNFGRWHDDFTEVFRHCTRPDARGKDICRRLKPQR